MCFLSMTYVRLRYKLNEKTKVKKEKVSRPKAKMQNGNKICKMEEKGATWKQKVQNGSKRCNMEAKGAN